MTALPVIDAARDKKAAKPSLLAGLGKKLMPGKKVAKASAEARQTVDPAPSIDPVDVLPADVADDANELLEPGSGAPDVRKILERVRASQQAAKGAVPTGDSGDRNRLYRGRPPRCTGCSHGDGSRPEGGSIEQQDRRRR